MSWAAHGGLSTGMVGEDVHLIPTEGVRKGFWRNCNLKRSRGQSAAVGTGKSVLAEERAVPRGLDSARNLKLSRLEGQAWKRFPVLSAYCHPNKNSNSFQVGSCVTVVSVLPQSLEESVHVSVGECSRGLLCSQNAITVGVQLLLLAWRLLGVGRWGGNGEDPRAPRTCVHTCHPVDVSSLSRHLAAPSESFALWEASSQTAVPRTRAQIFECLACSVFTPCNAHLYAQNRNLH